MALIKEKRLLQIGFTVNAEDTLKSKGEYTVMDNRMFRVALKNGDKENPMISIHEGERATTFPGAYTMKDLKFIMYFYLGEDQYTKFTDNWTEPITAKETKSDSQKCIEFTNWLIENCKFNKLHKMWKHKGTHYFTSDMYLKFLEEVPRKFEVEFKK